MSDTPQIQQVIVPPESLVDASIKRASETDSDLSLIVNVSPIRRKIRVATERVVSVEPFAVVLANDWWRSVLRPGRIKMQRDTDKPVDDYAWAWFPVSWAELGYEFSEEEMPARPRKPLRRAQEQKDKETIGRWSRYVRDTSDLPVSRDLLEKRFTRVNDHSWYPVYEPQGGPTVVSRVCMRFMQQWDGRNTLEVNTSQRYLEEYVACACNVDEDENPMGRNQGESFVDEPEALRDFAKRRLRELEKRKENELGTSRPRPLFSRKGYTGHR